MGTRLQGGRHHERPGRRIRVLALLLAGAIISCLGVVLFSASAAAKECPKGISAVADRCASQVWVPPPPTVTVTEYLTATETVTETETAYETVDRTVTETVDRTVTETLDNTVFVPTTVTVPTTVPTTVTEPTTVTVPTTLTVPTTQFVTGNQAVIDRVTQTDHVTETEFAVEQVTNTIVATYFAAPSLNPQTGDRPGVLLSSSQVSPGGTLTLTGQGYSPLEPIRFVLHSEPVELGTVTADSSGKFETTVTIPVNTAVGQHTIEVVGVSCGVTTTVPLTVVAAPVVAAQDGVAVAGVSYDGPGRVWSVDAGRALSYTGVNSAQVTAIGLALIAAGGTLLVMYRRRPVAGRHRG